jgi:hypothetical protein
LTRNFSSDLNLYSDCQCKLHFSYGYVSPTAGNESLQYLSIFYKNLLSDSMFLPHAARDPSFNGSIVQIDLPENLETEEAARICLRAVHAGTMTLSPGE